MKLLLNNGEGSFNLGLVKSKRLFTSDMQRSLYNPYEDENQWWEC